MVSFITYSLKYENFINIMDVSNSRVVDHQKHKLYIPAIRLLWSLLLSTSHLGDFELLTRGGI